MASLRFLGDFQATTALKNQVLDWKIWGYSPRVFQIPQHAMAHLQSEPLFEAPPSCWVPDHFVDVDRFGEATELVQPGGSPRELGDVGHGHVIDELQKCYV